MTINSLKTVILTVLCLALLAPGSLILAEKVSQKEIDNLKKEIEEKSDFVNDVTGKIKVYEENIKEKQEEKLTLDNQIEVLEQGIAKTSAEITLTETEISKLTSEIKLVKTKIEETQGDITTKKDQVSEYILNIYALEQKTNLEVLLTNDTLSDYFSHVEYSKNLQEQFQDTLDQLQTLKGKLKAQKTELDDSKDVKEDKKITLDVQKDSLQGENIYKNQLLVDVEEDEEKFKELVQQVKQEQDAVNSQIASLEKQMRTKIDQLNSEKGDREDDVNAPVSDDNFVMPVDFRPQWPVTGRTVTAYFHDPTYPFKRWFEHDAIDISMPQGSSMYAVDGGVVAVAKFDGSTSYSYISIVHAEGYSSVYGHASAVYVEPGQNVTKGQLIGLTGGMPGTAGAGYYTTGPHIHFGIRLNGIPVDPLNYL